MQSSNHLQNHVTEIIQTECHSSVLTIISHLQPFYLSVRLDFPYLTLNSQLTGQQLGKEGGRKSQIIIIIIIDGNTTTLEVSYCHLVEVLE